MSEYFILFTLDMYWINVKRSWMTRGSQGCLLGTIQWIPISKIVVLGRDFVVDESKGDFKEDRAGGGGWNPKFYFTHNICIRIYHYY